MDWVRSSAGSVSWVRNVEVHVGQRWCAVKRRDVLNAMVVGTLASMASQVSRYYGRSPARLFNTVTWNPGKLSVSNESSGITYNIYRGLEPDGSDSRRLNRDPLAAPRYVDRDIERGRTY